MPHTPFCGDRVNGQVARHVWTEGARVGDLCACGTTRLDAIGAHYAAVESAVGFAD